MDLRRQHRIIYQTKIRMRAPDRDVSVVARVQNLSARGMFVTATDLPAAGAEVQCRLTLGGERRTLRGRVAWVRQSSPSAPLKSPGAGIEFIDLDSQVAALLTRLVEPDDDRRQAVDVWFEGMAAPIRCHAIVVGGGLRLETRLPFMRLSSPVKVAFNQESPPATREGIVDGVTLEPSQSDGVPFLRIAVTMPPLDSAQGTIEARRNGPPGKNVADASIALGTTLVDPAVSRASNGHMTETPVITSRRDRSENTQRVALDEIVPPNATGEDNGNQATSSAAPSGLLNQLRGYTTAAPSWIGSGLAFVKRGGRFTFLVAGVALGALLVALFGGSNAVDQQARGESPTASHPAPGPRKKAEVAAPSTTAPVPATKPVAGSAGQPAPERAVATTPAAPPTGSQAAPNELAAAAPAPEGEPALAGVGPEIEPLSPPASPPASGNVTATAGITVNTDANRTVTITVPLEGNTARVFTKPIHYTDRSIVGLALLRARPPDSIGVGVVQPPGSPARVLIRRRGTGSLVRFAFEPRKHNAKLVQDGNALRLTLTPRR